MQSSSYLTARKWIKILGGPIAMTIILVLWYSVFMDENKSIFSLSVIGSINLFFFYISFYVISPRAIKSGSVKRLVLAIVFFSTTYTVVHVAVFGTQLVKLPFPFNTTDYPISFYLSILYVIALTLYLAGLSLHLVVNHLSISYESFSLLQKSYKNEIDALKLQMNPHFIANSLNNLSGMLQNKDVKGGISYTTELIGLVGKQINSSTEMSVAIKEEIQWLETYLKMEQRRMQTSFDFKISVDPKINPNSTIPAMVLQPILENCITHGFNTEVFDKKGWIEVSIKNRKSRSITIEIRDNGLGLNAKKAGSQRSRKSISTDNIGNRIKLINEMRYYYIRKSIKFGYDGTLVVIHIDPPIV